MSTKGICRVCELLDNDKTEKEIIYCNFCKAWICSLCENNWLRRGVAALKESGIKDFGSQVVVKGESSIVIMDKELFNKTINEINGSTKT